VQTIVVQSQLEKFDESMVAKSVAKKAVMKFVKGKTASLYKLMSAMLHHYDLTRSPGEWKVLREERDPEGVMAKSDLQLTLQFLQGMLTKREVALIYAWKDRAIPNDLVLRETARIDDFGKVIGWLTKHAHQYTIQSLVRFVRELLKFYVKGTAIKTYHN